MSNRIKLAGFFSSILLAIVLYYGLAPKPDVPVGPVMLPLVEGQKTLSFRGLHATDDTVVVVGGNNGTFGFSLDAGIHWVFMQIPGASESQFRSVWAIDHQNFLAVSAGAPTYIYKTTNRGHHWDLVFEDTAQSTFLDGMVFVNEQLGFVYGDPVDGALKLLRTDDGGFNWSEVEGPTSIDGEASFAASNSGMQWYNGLLTINTGGAVSRIHWSADTGKTWSSHYLELIQGLPSQGAFAHVHHGDSVFVVGGDYMNDTSRVETAALLRKDSTGMEEWELPQWSYGLAYCSDVDVDQGRFFFCGTAGVYFADSALHSLDTTAMHSLAHSGKYLFAAGPHGRIGRVFTGMQSDLNRVIKELEQAQKR
ncbi:MAG: hypothetical protein RL754_303 [Bacteroidota bacterium]|jgi:hypothetical protein